MMNIVFLTLALLVTAGCSGLQNASVGPPLPPSQERSTLPVASAPL
jgi:hypothetical protein